MFVATGGRTDDKVGSDGNIEFANSSDEKSSESSGRGYQRITLRICYCGVMSRTYDPTLSKSKYAARCSWNTFSVNKQGFSCWPNG